MNYTAFFIVMIAAMLIAAAIGGVVFSPLAAMIAPCVVFILFGSVVALARK